MPYYSNSSQPNMQHQATNEQVQLSVDPLADKLNKLINTLTRQQFWSKRIANQCRVLNVRGWGRWHECESDSANDEVLCLEKLFVDKLGITPNIEFDKLPDTQTTLTDINAFKNHFDTWQNNKQELIDIVNSCIREIDSVDMQLYKKFCCLVEKLQDDKVAIRMCKSRLDMADWGKHDMMIVSMKVHHYFEHEHKKGDRYNINLG